MLTGFKVPSLSCKCAFYRPEHNTKGAPVESVESVESTLKSCIFKG